MIQFDTKTNTAIEVCNDLILDAEEDGFTYLNCTYITSPKYDSDWWVNIQPNSYLTSGDIIDSLIMTHAINIPLAPQKHYLSNFGDFLKLTLIFPSVPKNWDSFNFYEADKSSSSLCIRNIKRNNTGVYHVKIQ